MSPCAPAPNRNPDRGLKPDRGSTPDGFHSYSNRCNGTLQRFEYEWKPSGVEPRSGFKPRSGLRLGAGAQGDIWGLQTSHLRVMIVTSRRATLPTLASGTHVVPGRDRPPAPHSCIHRCRLLL